jgi:hypothetical protein
MAVRHEFDVGVIICPRTPISSRHWKQWCPSGAIRDAKWPPGTALPATGAVSLCAERPPLVPQAERAGL